MDVCGPMAVPSHGGAEYLATFVDDYSRLSYVVPLVHKSEVTGAIRDTLVKWENQTGESLKSVRTDRGGEYLNQKLMHSSDTEECSIRPLPPIHRSRMEWLSV